jgi:hypothetical protein
MSRHRLDSGCAGYDCSCTALVTKTAYRQPLSPTPTLLSSERCATISNFPGSMAGMSEAISRVNNFIAPFPPAVVSSLGSFKQGVPHGPLSLHIAGTL